MKKEEGRMKKFLPADSIRSACCLYPFLHSSFCLLHFYMNDFKFAFRQLLKNPGFTAVAVLTLALSVSVLSAVTASADLAVRMVQIAPPEAKSLVPEVSAQGRFLAPQAISTVDISADGKFITVGTMAFSHDANVWQFAADGTVIARRHFPPWAPMQVATLAGGPGDGGGAGLLPCHFAGSDGVVWPSRRTARRDAEG